jgi:putative hydrolase of the HAD superfamily
MKYKAVIFDLYGTLIENFPESEGNAVLLRAASVLAVSSDNFISQWRAAYAERMIGAYRDTQACIRNICQLLGVQPTNEQIDIAAGIKADMTRREVTSYREGALEVLSYLKANGYKTGLVSNASMETTRVWSQTTLAPLIDESVFSCIEGMLKPDPRIFQIAMERLAVSSEECLYVADGMSQELTTASKLGIYSVLIKAPHNTRYEFDREDWSGPAISSLKELVTILEE